MIDIPEQEPVESLPQQQPDSRARLGQLIKRPFIKRPFTGPRLPWVLIVLALLIIVTDIAFTLIIQPIGYWWGNTNSYTGVQSLLSLGPWLTGLISLLYLGLMAVLLRAFSRPIAFVLWMILYFYHFRGVIDTAECGLSGFFQINNSAACETVSLVLPFVLTALFGLILARVLFPGGKLVTAEPRFPIKAVVLTAAWGLLLVFGLVRAISLPDTGWIPVFSENNPTPRIDGMIAYDSNRHVAVLFGGHTQVDGQSEEYNGDTWEWDGVDWVQRFPAESPPGRRVHGMAYDKVRGVVVLFGGKAESGAMSDTWEWDGEQWHLRTPLNSPPARCCHRLFYDDQRGRVVVYGGFSGEGAATVFYNDGWEWDGETWTQIFFNSITPAASNFDIVHDSGRNRTIAVLTGTGTWLWEDNQWLDLSVTQEIPERQSFRIAYNPIEAQVVLFGGLHEDIFQNDTWLLDGESWQELEVSRPPAGRWGHVLFYDSSRQRIMLFGGFDGVNYLNDMWELAISD